MNELPAVRELGVELDPATGGPPPDLRHRVHLRFTDSPAKTQRRRWRGPVGWSLATSGALAAGLAVALIVGGSGGGAGHGPRGRTGDSKLTANEVLMRAAAQVRANPTPVPRADQLLYVESIQAFPDGNTMTDVRPKIREVWLSIDGTHDGLIREKALPGRPVPPMLNVNVPLPGCRGGKEAVVDQHDKVRPDQFQDCEARPAYQPDLPTDGDAMFALLRKKAGGNEVAMFTEVEGLVHERYLTSAQLAALFEATSRLSRVVVVPDVVDLNGRHGIAVAWLVPPFDPELKSWDKPPVAQQQLIFDPTTYAYLGFQQVTLVAKDGHQPGETVWGSAELKKAIVDKVDQRP